MVPDPPPTLKGAGYGDLLHVNSHHSLRHKISCEVHAQYIVAQSPSGIYKPRTLVLEQPLQKSHNLTILMQHDIYPAVVAILYL